MSLDLEFVRSRFPAFSDPDLQQWSFFENAGGSYPCDATVAALDRFYRTMKVQPYSGYGPSDAGGAAMDRSRQRWAEALGVATSEVNFGPSTSANTYVLSHAIGATLEAGDEVIVTNQDHEANTGAIRRATEAAGATLVEWKVDPASGMLDPEDLGALMSSHTRFVAFPHASNIVGVENDVAQLTAMAHEAGARVIVDGVSAVPHGIPDLGSMNPDVYLFSLYKVYSVHQGVMVVRRGLVDELPYQGHGFNAHDPTKRLTPAGPDHAQEAAAGAVLDYVEDLAAHHGVTGADLGDTARAVSELWRQHEDLLVAPVLDMLAGCDRVRLLGPTSLAAPLRKAPTIAFVPSGHTSAEVAAGLVTRSIATSHGDFYARRVLEGMGVDLDNGVVRLSWVHYTTQEDIERLLEALDAVLHTSHR